jgi:hypothetical protein
MDKLDETRCCVATQSKRRPGSLDSKRRQVDIMLLSPSIIVTGLPVLWAGLSFYSLMF